MCICTVLVLKVSVVFAIIVLAILNVLDILEGTEKLGKATTKGRLLLIVCFVLDSAIIAILCAGLYATIRQNIKLLQLLIFALITYCLGKMSLWIVAGNQGGVVELVVTQTWYKLTLVATVIGMVLLTCFCLRIKDDDGEDPPFS
ncbi:uncharacterized protein LOC111078918 isoform X1 [Drosophila obscura]|uniref:uncharacterized protein LOC111078918 isoform X1 n=2 Tax=Drosophila obscura TaxID=7282 RepID=UPI001BB24933|nr:uncharacterized protein LOC111078918 isoform X1 [Drosophila obscura]